VLLTFRCTQIALVSTTANWHWLAEMYYSSNNEVLRFWHLYRVLWIQEQQKAFFKGSHHRVQASRQVWQSSFSYCCMFCPTKVLVNVVHSPWLLECIWAAAIALCLLLSFRIFGFFLYLMLTLNKVCLHNDIWSDPCNVVMFTSFLLVFILDANEALPALLEGEFNNLLEDAEAVILECPTPPS